MFAYVLINNLNTMTLYRAKSVALVYSPSQYSFPFQK